MNNSKVRINVDSELQDLIPQFLENRKKDIQAMSELVERKDLSAIAQLAHKIKGAAAGYGFRDLSDLAAQMEQAAKRNDLSPLESLSENMKDHFERIEIHFVSM